MSIDFEPVKYTAEDIGCMLFESITKGLYSKPLHALREYVQNEVESEPRPTKVEVVLDGRNLSIIGDGGGMDEKEIEEAKKVGFSFKDPKSHFGFRGIGIWSGVSIADKIIISTKKRGMKKSIVLEIDCIGIRKELQVRARKSLTQMLTEHVRRAMVDAPEEEHGTHVQLLNLLTEVMDYFSEDNVRNYMSQVLPVDLDPRFKYRNEVKEKITRHVANYYTHNIWFNGQRIYRPPYIRNLERPIFGAIKHRDKDLAFYWMCLNKERGKIQEDCRGMIYKQWNFAVGDRRSCRPFINATGHLADWYTGEVHVTDTEIIADSTRMLFECTPAFDTLERLLEKEMQIKGEEARKKSHIETLDEKLKEAKSLSKKTEKFKSARAKLRRLVDIEEATEYLKKKSRHKWTPASRKQRIRNSIGVLSESYEELSGVPFEPIEVGKPPEKVKLPKEIHIEEISSLSDLAKSLNLTGLSKNLLEIVEEVLGKFFVGNVDALKRVRSAIVEAVIGKIKG